MRLLRRSREQARHARAVVRQEIGAEAAAHPETDWARNRTVAARLRQHAETRLTGVNTTPPRSLQNRGEGLPVEPVNDGGTSRRPEFLRLSGFLSATDRAQCPCNGWGCIACGG